MNLRKWKNLLKISLFFILSNRCFIFFKIDIMFKKMLTSFILMFSVFAFSFVSANVDLENTQYSYFYGQGCSHCLKVESYFEESKIDKKINIDAYEIWFDEQGLETFKTLIAQIPLPLEKTGTPFLVIKGNGEKLDYLMGADPIIDYFKEIEKQLEETSSQWQESLKEDGVAISVSNSGSTTWSLDSSVTPEEEKTLAQRPLAFLAVMLPAALSDSINPCAFAVMLLLLGTILTKSKDRKKTLLAGALFCFAIFLSYFLMGIGVFKLLATASITSTFKRIVGIVGILVWLANIKDYFRYGKGFVMEVPRAWRPRMMKLIQAVVSPWGAFAVGILVSLFLLPCSSWPYLVILWLLRAESASLNHLGIWYLAIYNFIFILPMLIITFLVGNGVASVENLAKIKNKNTKLIHLIVGLLILGLWIYVIGSLYWR